LRPPFPELEEATGLRFFRELPESRHPDRMRVPKDVWPLR
jgi:hypothetical protein